MCGFVGVAQRGPVGERRTLTCAGHTLLHRGPDAGGDWWSEDGTVGLAHRRLAIIDLSHEADQPMPYANGELHVVYNGEIYNFREVRSDLERAGYTFRTRSDTEVLLAAYKAWGTECLERLNGMFAFAIHDAARRTVFLARDRAGEKPLFYAHLPGVLLFASELKALLQDQRIDRVIDPAGLDEYLAYGYTIAPNTLLRGVRKLPPAHAMVYDVRTDEIRTWQYWRLPGPAAEPYMEGPDLVDELESRLASAVRSQMVSDVPLGVLLSGGIDSSLVTAFAARASSTAVRTFTITFPGHGAYNEAAHARLVASHFGTSHTELAAEPATVELLPELAKQFDDPIADSSMVPTYLVSRLIRRTSTVALGGDGGDELFGGYRHYSWWLRQQAMNQRMPVAIRAMIGAVAQQMPVGVMGRTYLMGFSATEDSTVSAGLLFDARTRQRLSPVLRQRSAEPAEVRRRTASERGVTTLQKLTLGDFGTYLPEDILVKVDRASMLASLEVRAPFLDRAVMEFAFGQVPDAYRATSTSRKVLPRQLAARVLPADADLQRKRGFSIPLEAWFRGDWGEFITSIVRDADPDLLDRKSIDRLLARQKGRMSNSQRLFSLAMLELWRREYNVRSS